MDPIHYSVASTERELLKAKAIRSVAIAIRKGRLPPIGSCYCVDCGAFATQYEHRDYRKPLDVEPVCRSCNIRRGPALPQITPTNERKNKDLLNEGKGDRWSTLGSEGNGYTPLECKLTIDVDWESLDPGVEYFRELDRNRKAMKAKTGIESANRLFFGIASGKCFIPEGVARYEYFKNREVWRL